jgi:hypothetical protein
MSDRIITDGDINWELAATPHLEKIPRTAEYLVSQSKEELVDYILDLREDAATLRRHLHATTGALANSTQKLQIATDTIERLHEELRMERRRHQ